MGRVYAGTYEMREKLQGRTAISAREVAEMEKISLSTARRMYKFVNGRISVEMYIRRHLEIYSGKAPAYL